MENDIYAENLQNVLLVISGDRDIEAEVQNDVNNFKWKDAGVYDEETGLFYIREGEHTGIQKHFQLFKFNRMSKKTAVKQYTDKVKPKAPTFKPHVSQKTAKISEKRRQKLLGEGGENTNIVNVLYAPQNMQGDKLKVEQMQKELEAKEL
jgi:hypothetical protein